MDAHPIAKAYPSLWHTLEKVHLLLWDKLFRLDVVHNLLRDIKCGELRERRHVIVSSVYQERWLW